MGMSVLFECMYECIYICMYVHSMHAWYTQVVKRARSLMHGVSKRAGPLVLELGMVVNHSAGAGSQSLVLPWAAHAIAPALLQSFICVWRWRLLISLDCNPQFSDYFMEICVFHRHLFSLIKTFDKLILFLYLIMQNRLLIAKKKKKYLVFLKKNYCYLNN